jgi:HemY protein
MLRLVLFLASILAAAAGLHWLADRPGALTLSWQGYVVETSAFRAVILLSVLVAASILGWGLFRRLWKSPAVIGQIFTRRRERRGLDAISSGMIAIGSGDKSLATRAAVQARKSLPNEPLTHLLRAQAAQLQGDTATSRRIYEAMLASPDTEQLGLRGLYLEAQRVGEDEAAQQFAGRALKLNPKLEWPAASLFDLQCKSRDWVGALETLSLAKKHGQIDKKIADRRRAVLLTAQAQMSEDEHPDQALALASEAHGLAPDLIPAAAIAGRVLAARGQTPKAAKIIQRTWKAAPQPDLAVAYAYARPGDSQSDRLQRIRQLAATTPGNVEGAVAIATIAVESRDWDSAKAALAPLLEKNLTQRVCMLMARIEGEGFKDAGRVREWLARAVHAQRDPVWTADGMVAEQWAPVSPVTGALDAFEWRVPVSTLETPEAAVITQRMEDLIKLGAASAPALLHADVVTARREPATIEMTPATKSSSNRPTKTVEDWLHDEHDQDPPASGGGHKTNGGNAQTAAYSAKPKPAVATPGVKAAAVSNSVGDARRVAADKLQPIAKSTDPSSTYLTPHAPDDPGTEPLDATTAKSQLERYRLIGAKN